MSGTRPTSPRAPATRPALLLVGLGAAQGTDPLDRHAAALRTTRRYASVSVARITSGPSPREILDRIAAPTVDVLPFLLGDGYCSRVLLPRILALADSPARTTPTGAAQVVRCLQPLGVAPGMTDLLRQRLLRVCRAEDLVPHETNVLLFAHGLSSGAEATEAHRHARGLAADFADVRAAFLEQAPLFADALRGRGPCPTIVIGFFVASGLHGGHDISETLAAARDDGAGPIIWAGNIGEDDGMTRLLLEHVDAQSLELENLT